ncbi:TSUP family transporter [Reinekea blandensis]
MQPVELSSELLMLLFAVALLAGWIDAIAGGGGLIALPTLMLVGLSPVQALATNKCQGFVGTLTATLTLLQRRQLPKTGLPVLMLMTAIGAALGTLLIQMVDTRWLSWAVPVLLISVALYFLLVPGLGEQEKKPRMSERLWSRTAIPLIGFYDGFFGPGTGSFFAASGVMLRGKTLVQATVVAKPLNFTSNIISLVLFAFGGQVVWLAGGVMMLGQMIGAYLGTRTIFWGGARLIRPLVIVMCVAMTIRHLTQL